MRRARVLLSVVLGAALVLCGCGGESSPKPAPYTRSPSASPTPPATPAALNGTDEAAAKALVRYYLESLGYASNTGDTGPLASTAVDSCEVCSSAVQKVKNLYTTGGRISGSDYTIVEYQEVSADKVGFKVRALVVSAEESVRSSSTSPPTINPKSQALFTFFLTKESGRLFVDNWGFKK